MADAFRGVVLQADAAPVVVDGVGVGGVLEGVEAASVGVLEEGCIELLPVAGESLVTGEGIPTERERADVVGVEPDAAGGGGAIEAPVVDHEAAVVVGFDAAASFIEDGGAIRAVGEAVFVSVGEGVGRFAVLVIHDGENGFFVGAAVVWLCVEAQEAVRGELGSEFHGGRVCVVRRKRGG